MQFDKMSGDELRKLAAKKCVDVEEVMKNRFLAKPDIGSTRRDGSDYEIEKYIQAGWPEFFGCEAFGEPFNTTIILNRGDDGWDFKKTIQHKNRHETLFDVKWLSKFDDGTPRLSGDVIANQDCKIEPAVLIAVGGSIETGFELVGWVTFDDIKLMPKKNYNWGEKYRCPPEKLRFISELREFIALGKEVTDVLFKPQKCSWT